MHSFRAERWLAAVFLVAIALMLAGLLVVRYGGSGPRSSLRRSLSDLPTRDELREDYEAGVRRDRAAYTIGVGLMAAGSGAAGGCLLWGLLTAFGIGPAWLGVRRAGYVIEKFYEEDGLMSFGAAPTERSTAYVRVKLESGLTAEWFLPTELMPKVKVGERIVAKVVGRRLARLL